MYHRFGLRNEGRWDSSIPYLKMLWLGDITDRVIWGMPPSIQIRDAHPSIIRRVGSSLFLIRAAHEGNNAGMRKLSGAGDASCRGFASTRRWGRCSTASQYRKDFQTVKIYFQRRAAQPSLANVHFRYGQNSFLGTGNMAVSAIRSLLNQLTKPGTLRCPTCSSLFEPRPSTLLTMNYTLILHYI